MEVMKGMSRKAKVTMAVVLTCAVLIAAAAVVVSILALSDGKESGEAGRAADGSRQVQESGQEEGGNKTAASGEEARTQAGDDSGASGQNPTGSQPEDSTTANYPGLTPTQIPASSVDEALLRQAAQDYIKNTLGDTQAYQITQLKISAIDPAWGKVTFYRQDQDLTIETLFYRREGNWEPAQGGPGTPALPTDI